MLINALNFKALLILEYPIESNMLPDVEIRRRKIKIRKFFPQ